MRSNAPNSSCTDWPRSGARQGWRTPSGGNIQRNENHASLRAWRPCSPRHRPDVQSLAPTPCPDAKKATNHLQGPDPPSIEGCALAQTAAARTRFVRSRKVVHPTKSGDFPQPQRPPHRCTRVTKLRSIAPWKSVPDATRPTGHLQTPAPSPATQRDPKENAPPGKPQVGRCTWRPACPGARQMRLNTKEPLVPPKPKLFFRATPIFRSRAVLAQ